MALRYATFNSGPAKKQGIAVKLLKWGAALKSRTGFRNIVMQAVIRLNCTSYVHQVVHYPDDRGFRARSMAPFGRAAANSVPKSTVRLTTAAICIFNRRTIAK